LWDVPKYFYFAPRLVEPKLAKSSRRWLIANPPTFAKLFKIKN
jgi:hypothetical protein